MDKKVDKKEEVQTINIEFPKEIIGGVYSNHLIISHTPEEFIMDFSMAAPPQGRVVARILTSPGHMKRILKALNVNLKKYEDRFGNIKEAPEPPTEAPEPPTDGRKQEK